MTQAYLDHIKSARPALVGAHIGWLADLREAAAGHFAVTGFPGRKDEAFKYADLKPLIDTPFVGETAARQETDRPFGFLPWTDVDGSRLAFVDGQYRADLSGGVDVHAKPLSTLLLEDNAALKSQFGDAGDASALAQLNLALASDGLVLRVPQGVDAGTIQVLHISSGTIDHAAAHVRTLVHLESGARATLIERQLGSGSAQYWINSVCDLRLEAGAQLQHYQWQAEAPQAVATALTRAALDSEARYERFTLSTGAASARSEIRVDVRGQGSHVGLSGVQLGRARQVLDTVTHLRHDIGHSTSNQTYRAVVDEKARTAFSGKVYVARDAQKTDAQQSSRNLLLARTAEANTKPELEIYADDVQCAHGATVGELDKKALFYLASRGVSPDAAKAILVQAFVADVIEEIALEPVREAYLAATLDWLMAQL